MKILLLTQASPFEESTGANQRTKFLYESLCALGRVDVAIFVFSDEPDRASENENGQVFHINLPTGGLINRPNIPIRSRTYTNRLGGFVDLDSYEVAVSRYVRFATKFHLSKNSRVIIDYDDAYYTIPWKSVGTTQTLIRELIKKVNDVSTRLLIKAGIYKFDHYFFVSERDQAHYPRLPASVLPNIPVRPNLAPNFSLPETPAILFVGLMTYQPNIEAVDGFIEKCWDKVLATFPETKLLIAGKSSLVLKEKWSKVKNCIPLGFVENLNDVYRQVTFSIAPIWSGGGSNIKILEAYMYGKAVVASSYSYEGLRKYIRRNQDILVADGFESFCEQCISLLAKPEHAAELAKNGNDQINRSLSFDQFRDLVIQGAR